MVIRTQEYNKLKNDSKFLECLMAAGLADWEGYSKACELYDAD